MKKQLILPVLALAALMGASTAHAAALTVSPQTVAVAPGDTVTVTVAVAPQGATISAVKADIAYSSLLSVKSFALAPNWVAMTKSGFDQMSTGSVVKSAGYPGGFTATTTFGTITFTAKSTGTATIALKNTSEIYDKSGVNDLSGTQGKAVVTIAMTAPTTGGSGGGTTATSTATSTSPTTSSPTKPSTTNASSHIATTRSATTQTAVTTNTSAATTTATTTGTSGLLATATPLAAAAGAAPGAGFFNSGWSWLVLLLILLAAGGLWYYYNRRNSEGSVSPLSVNKK